MSFHLSLSKPNLQLALQQPPRETFRAETRAADIQQHEHPALGRDRPTVRGIGENTHIERAIVDKDARIGRDVRLVNQRGLKEADGDNYAIRDGIELNYSQGLRQIENLELVW